jgi:23S rRNA (pseudouridine1915-N3)-methyltransferase
VLHRPEAYATNFVLNNAVTYFLKTGKCFCSFCLLMLDIHLIMVGKTRESFIHEGLAFYGQRLQPFVQLTLKSVRDEKEGKKLTAELIKAKEGERLRAQIPPKAYVVALDPQGKELTTPAFAAWLAKREEDGRPLAFLLGGHLGLDEATLAAAHEQLALSQLTLTHELSRLVLLEQLYRAKTILRGHPYHV